METCRQFFICFIVSLALSATASAAERNSSECLGCHGDEQIVGQGAVRLYVDPLKYDETSHKTLGCVSCHDTVTSDHPGNGIRPSHPTCRGCHPRVAQEYAQSLHGGNARCADCHNPHAARKPAMVSGVEINGACGKCHDKVSTVKSHKKWLPQAALHLDDLPCITCHTGSKDYVITLFIETMDSGIRGGGFRLATYEELRWLAGTRAISSILDTNSDKRISLEELRQFNKVLRQKNMRLKGVMMPEFVTHSFQILRSRWNCTFCHASGAGVMQAGFVAFPGKAGSYTKLGVEKGAILDILYGTPDIYMMGATRSLVMSLLGALLIACGLIMPVVHGTLRLVTRKRRAAAVNPQAREIDVYLLPVTIRIWHWLHALCIMTLCITGLQIRFPEYVGIFENFRGAVRLHNLAGVTLAVSMVFWVIYYTVITRAIGKTYVPSGEDVRHGLVRQVLYYFYNYFYGKPNPHHATPENKFNALQKLAYLVIMFFVMPLVTITGLLIWDVHPLQRWIFDLGGIKLLDGVHFLAACSLCAFFFTHVYLTTLGLSPFAEIRAMWTGWEKETEEDKSAPDETEAEK